MPGAGPSCDSGSHRETKRLRALYGSTDFKKRQAASRPGNKYLLDARRSAILRALKRLCHGRRDAAYLDLGCGHGDLLEDIADARLGIASLVGVDLLPEQLTNRPHRPEVTMICADAAQLPFRSSSFDIVSQVMVLSLAVDPVMRRAIASEMLRVLRPGGHLVSLDLRYGPAHGRHRIGLGKRTLRDIFPNLPTVSSVHGLLPPLARLLAPLLPGACRALERLPVLRVYRLDVMRRPEVGPTGSGER